MPFQLQILHSSDMEAGIPAIADAPRFAGVVNALKNQDANKDGKADYANTVILSSGDNFIPGPFFSVAADPSLNSVLGAAGVGRADIAIMNAIGYNAADFGNHDFDLGTSVLNSMIAPSGAYAGAQFPFISANLDFSNDPNIRARVTADGQEASTIKGRIAKSAVITVNGEKIGIVGVTTPQLPVISSPGPNVVVSPANSLDYDTLVKDYIQPKVDELTKQGINKVILLAHMQELDIEQTLAGKLKDVDVIIAGGSHINLPDITDYLRAGDTLPSDPNLRYPIVKTGTDGKPVLVVNTAANYRYVGRLVTTFDDNGVIDLKSLDPVVNGAYATDDQGLANVGGTVDPNVKKITDALAAVLQTKDGNIAGSTKVFLNGTRESVRTEETNLGDLTADANLFAARQTDPTVTISLKNGGGIRDNIGAVLSTGGLSTVQRVPPPANPLANKQDGQVSQLDVENSLRFNNGLAMVTLTADQLKQVMEWGVASTGPNQYPGVFPQIGGFAFSYDVTKAARTVDANGNVTEPGKRIQSLAITDDNGNIKDILVQNGVVQGNPDRTFRMVALDFNILPGTYTDANGNGKWDSTETFRQGGSLGQGGGDGYPFPVFIQENPTRANLVTLAPSTGKTYDTAGTEQKAFNDYLKAKFPTSATAFNLADTPKSGDFRIQDLSARADSLKAPTLASTVTIPGNATDLFPLNGASNTANINRLGGFGSDLFYDYRQNVYYALSDRGPGGGVIPFQTRVEQFTIDIDPATGKINSYKLQKTIPFTIPAGTTLNGVTYTTATPFNGLNPKLLNNDGSKLGLSQDPEGFVVGANGNFFVSDEYGPSIYEFSPTGSFIRAFTQPDNVIPKNGTSPYFAADGGTITTGRQDNRGYEGLAISPDGTKLFAMLQDPLQNEGTPNGRNSRNMRIVRFDVATGQSDAQYIYQLESIADINDRIPGTANDFAANAQGRNIGISSLTAINNNEFLVIERDNRGVGIDDPTGSNPIGSKRVYKINLTGATDVSKVDLTGTNTLPASVTPVSKSLFIDVASTLQAAGQTIPEKFEGITVGPQLADGSFSLLLATDNDYSVTQNSTNTQFDVYTNGVSTVQVPIDSPAPTAPAGQPVYTLLPSYIYSFKTQTSDLSVTPQFDFSVGNYTVQEGKDLGLSNSATVTVTRRGNLAGTNTVQLQLSDGTAKGGSTASSGIDYNNTPINVTFNAGETSKNVSIPIFGDLLNEPDETVNLTLANPSTGTVVGTKQPKAVLTIQNFAVPALPNGVASGDTTQNSTVLWTRSINPGTVTFEYSTKSDFSTITGRATANVTNALQPVKVNVTGLTPDTNYFFRATDATGATASGKFSTVAAVGSQTGLTFGVAGDWRGELSPYPAISNVPQRNLKFFLEFGDTIYADYPSPALRNSDGTEKAQATTLDDYRIKQSEVYSTRYGKNTWSDLRASTSVLATIDDHEVINDFAGGAPVTSDARFGQTTPNLLINDSTLYENGLQAFQEYNPINDKFYGATGDNRTANERQLYRYNTFGSDAATFVLDARSFRDDELAGVANPTDPTQVAQFLTKSFDPSRTLLGKQQLQDLKNDLLKADKDGVTWKFVMIPEPIQNLGVVGATDRFEGYAAERTEILKFINDNKINNVVFVSADIHGTVVNNLTYQNAPGQAQIATNAFEITTGSVAFDAPFGPTVAQLATAAGIITADQKKQFDSLPTAGKDAFIKNLVNGIIKPLGYDPLGLNDNLAQANGLINAKLLQGDYVAANTYGWSEFNIDKDTQKLTVTTYGIDPYTRAQLEANPTAITSLQPRIVSQFEVAANSLSTANLLKPTDNGIFTIKGGGGKPKLQVSLTGFNSGLVNELGVFTVDDAATGKIGNLTPGAAGYAEAALARSKTLLSVISNVPNGFNQVNQSDISRLLELGDGDKLRFYLVKNSTSDAVRGNSALLGNVVFADPSTQKVTANADGSYSLGFKDGTGGDFNNLAVKIQPSTQELTLGTNLQGSKEGEVFDLRSVKGNVKANFTINREALYNNVVGFYKVADSNGGIDINGDGKADITPGQAGYAQAAMNARVTDINLAVANQGTATFNDKLLTGGSIFAPFILTNGRTVDQVLAGQLDQAYFVYGAANSDKVDHIRLLGNNTFGFEDIAGGGDFDYNDVIIKATLTPA